MYRGFWLWEAQSIVFYVSGRLWEAHSVVFYEVLMVLGGVGCLTKLRGRVGPVEKDLTSFTRAGLS